MSPGDGVWSSPSRGLLHDGDQIVPELHRRNKAEEVKSHFFQTRTVPPRISAPPPPPKSSKNARALIRGITVLLDIFIIVIVLLFSKLCQINNKLKQKDKYTYHQK